MTPQEARAIREQHGLSVKDFSLALNLPADGRQVRAWEKGIRRGEPYSPTGTQAAAIRYLDAILDVLAERPSRAIVARLENDLPEHLRGR